MITGVKIFDTKEFIKSLVEKNKSKKKLNFQEMSKKKTEIIIAYNEEAESIKKNLDCFNSRICTTCGSDVRLVWDQFYGCTNYKDQTLGRHKTYSIDYYDNDFRVDIMWLRNIKSKAGVGNASISSLLQFIIEELNLSDLALEFTGYSTEINDFTLVKERAKKQEDEFLSIVSDYFEKIIPQCGIEITTNESRRPKKRIADFIASANNDVFYIEIKNTLNDYNEDQFHETFEGFEFLLNSTGDNRKLYGCLYYFENPPFVIEKELDILEILKENAIRIGGCND